MRNVSDKSCRENQNTHCVFSTFFFFSKIVPFMGTWKNIVQRGRPQMTKWRMRIACWIPKATNTHTGCVILRVFQCNSGYVNAPQCYVIRTLPVFFILLCISFRYHPPLSSSETSTFLSIPQDQYVLWPLTNS
jgi:hypothetical protein